MGSSTDHNVARGVARLRTMMANVYFVADPRRDAWVLIDAGVAGYAGAIRRRARRLFGPKPPAAILLTHGHFDHVGSLPHLLRRWSVPVYAHAAEHDHLRGARPYPPPNPSAGGGLLSRLSVLYPRGPIDIGGSLDALPRDGSVPLLPGWRWIHTPGHCAGHVAFFRQEDRVLISGDAVVTTRQESLWSVVRQRLEVRPPPAYFTTDWPEARRSVRVLRALRPEVLASGHGRPARGSEMRHALEYLDDHFSDVVPRGAREIGFGALSARPPGHDSPP